MSTMDVISGLGNLTGTTADRNESTATAQPANPTSTSDAGVREVTEADVAAMTFSEAPRPLAIQSLSLLILALLAVMTVLTQLGPVIIPVLAAIFLFFIIRPFTLRLSRWGVPPWVTYVLITAGLVGTIAILTMLISGDAQRFTAQIPQMEQRAEELLKMVPTFGGAPLHTDRLPELFAITPETVFHSAFGTAWHFAESILMVLFYLVFMMLDADRLPSRIRLAFPKQGDKLVRSFEKISDGISRFIRVKTFISLGMAVSVGLILLAFGVSNWILWAFLTFLLNYITYIGSLLALIPPVVISLLEFDHISIWIILTIVLLVNRFLWIDFLEIRYTGQQLRINNVLLLFSIIFWGWFWGIPGMVLAVPMLSATRIILAQFEATRPWALLISED